MNELGDIWDALSTAEALAESAVWNARGVDARETAKWRQATILRGRQAYDRISAKLPRAMEALEASERAYDRHVTREPLVESCSCHISAPCSFCMSKEDEDASA